MKDEMQIVIAGGEVRFIHDDDLAEAMRGLGTSTTARASHVEPPKAVGKSIWRRSRARSGAFSQAQHGAGSGSCMASAASDSETPMNLFYERWNH